GCNARRGGPVCPPRGRHIGRPLTTGLIGGARSTCLRRLLRLSPHDLIEAPQQLLALRVWARLVYARIDAGLRLLRNPPVLAVRQVPELDRIIRLKTRLCELRWMEVPLADDLRPIVRPRPQRVRHHVVR